MKIHTKILLLIISIVIILAILIPSYTYVPPERRVASELLSNCHGLKNEITDSIKNGLLISDPTYGIKPYEARHEEYGMLTCNASAEGMITGYSQKYGLRVTLTPDFDGETVEWACDFHPVEFAPVMCR